MVPFRVEEGGADSRIWRREAPPAGSGGRRRCHGGQRRGGGGGGAEERWCRGEEGRERGERLAAGG